MIVTNLWMTIPSSVSVSSWTNTACCPWMPSWPRTACQTTVGTLANGKNPTNPTHPNRELTLTKHILLSVAFNSDLLNAVSGLLQTLCGEMFKILFHFSPFIFFFFVCVGGVCALGPAHHCRDSLSQGSGSPLLESFDCGEWACGAPPAWPESALCLGLHCGRVLWGTFYWT